MKTATKVIIYLLPVIIVSLLTACGGGGGGDTTSGSKSAGSTIVVPGAATINGVVADGYLRGARVYLDRNLNSSYDNGEPTALSAAGGAFTLEINSGEGDLYPVIAEVIAGQTVDEETGQAVAHGYQLEAPAGKGAFVSPLTTLVQQELEKNPSFSVLEAVLNIRAELGIADSVSIFSDYVSHGTGGSQAGDAQAPEEYTRAHKAARVVAELMGRLKADIAQNLGGQVAVSEQKTVAFMVSDQILQQGVQLKQALDNERNNGVPMDVTALISIIESAVPVNTLNADLLAKYEQRAEQNLPTWDMQPPALLSRSPQAAAVAPIDVTVGIIFDEPLDETLIGSNLLQLNGPNGTLTGVVSYNTAQKQLNFVPDQVLLPFSSYQVRLNKDLADTLGNQLGEELTWNFTTTFDKLPPPLPDF